MSFEATARDLFDLFQLARKVVNTCRKACGEQEPLTREVVSLYGIIDQLEREAGKPGSSLHWQDDVDRKEFEDTIFHCQKVLRVLNQVLEKYTFSRRKVSAKKALIRFGNGEVLYMSDLIQDISTQKTALASNLRLLTASSRGSVEWPLGKKFPRMKQSLHRMMEKKGSSHDGSSLSSSYSDDERTVWKEIRKELVRGGWGDVVKKHRKAIKKYVKSLSWSDTFDEIPPARHESINRYPQESHRPETYSPEPYPQETSQQQDFPQQDFPQNIPQPSFPPLNFPPQNLPLQNFPPQNFPSQNFPPQNFPPQNFPPQNFPPQNFPPQNFPPQSFPPQQFPPQNFSQDSFPQQDSPQQNFSQQNSSQDSFPQQSFQQPNFPQQNFVHEATPQVVYPQEYESQSHNQASGRSTPRSDLASPIPPPLYIPPSVSDECEQFDEKVDIELPPQNGSHFSARPYDLAETFQCSDKDTWNDMMESLVTTLIDTSKTIYFPCSICKKMITTAQAQRDRSQNWCRNCFLSIVYNVLYYPTTPPEWCGLRPISDTRMAHIMTPTFRGLWMSSYEALRAMRGRPAGGMLVPSDEEPPLLLYRHPAVKDENSGRTLRTAYFEIAYFEEPFSSFVARKKQKAM